MVCRFPILWCVPLKPCQDVNLTFICHRRRRYCKSAPIVKLRRHLISSQTVSSIYSFFLAMTLHPEVMKKAQAEIDAVVGSDRLPGFEDRENLPYVDALAKEVLRWNSVVPTGKQTPHTNMFSPFSTMTLRRTAPCYGRRHPGRVFHSQRFLGHRQYLVCRLCLTGFASLLMYPRCSGSSLTIRGHMRTP
jgi:hypothetical protein